ncbi:MAG: hypothetical protein ACK58J_17230, partial [Planctomyces sp.]
ASIHLPSVTGTGNSTFDAAGISRFEVTTKRKPIDFFVERLPFGNSTFDAARISRFEVTRVAVPRCCRSLHGLGTASDKHAAEIWIFDADALNLCDADSIPREVLLSRGPPDRLRKAARAFFLGPHTTGGLPRKQT